MPEKKKYNRFQTLGGKPFEGAGKIGIHFKKDKVKTKTNKKGQSKTKEIKKGTQYSEDVGNLVQSKFKAKRVITKKGVTKDKFVTKAPRKKSVFGKKRSIVRPTSKIKSEREGQRKIKVKTRNGVRVNKKRKMQKG